MNKDKKLLEASWQRGKLGLVLMGQAMFSKPLIQFFVDGWGYVPSLLLDLRPNYGGGNEYNGDLLQSVPCLYCCCQFPPLCNRTPLALASPGYSWTLTDMSGPVSYEITAPFSWVLVHTSLCLCPPRICFLSPISSVINYSLGVLGPFSRSPGWEICCGSWHFLNSARISLV